MKFTKTISRQRRDESLALARHYRSLGVSPQYIASAVDSARRYNAQLIRAQRIESATYAHHVMQVGAL